jgi:hypothetical protein
MIKNLNKLGFSRLPSQQWRVQMSDIPVITQPEPNKSGWGTTPRIFGTAPANSSVEIFQVDSGNRLGGGVAINGFWAIDINIPPNQWFMITARSYQVYGQFSNWSPPFNIHS